MTRQKKILVLFEDGIVRKESFQYSIELARRLEIPVALLMLVSDESGIESADAVLERELQLLIEQAGIDVSKEVRSGDKATELLKYLASDSSLAAIVWGSDREMVEKLGAGRQHHWLQKLAGVLPCSIISPVSKNKEIQHLTEG
jgi:hypothetical protein